MGHHPELKAGKAAASFFAENVPIRATVAEIDLKAIANNVRSICRRVHPAQVMAVVKANGYGHGAVQVSRQALKCGAIQLGVALLEEGIYLRKSGIAAPVLVFGGVFENQIDLFFRYDLQMTVYDAAMARAISKRATALGRTANVHVKIDTGMGRVGITENAAEAVEHIASLVGIKVNGVCTHLATSDELDKSNAALQLRRFRAVLENLKSRGIDVPFRHAANSGAVLDLPDSYFNLVRPGVMIYGYYPSSTTSESIRLQPAMRLATRILHVKKVPAGTYVSYGRTFQTKKPSLIATLPIGYADGYSRRFSNDMTVLVRGQRCNVIGRVCMDQIMIDLGGLKEVQCGEEAVLMGTQGNDKVSIYDWCEKLDTIPYEVTCNISKRVPRRYE